MTKLSAKIIEETLDYEDVTPKAKKDVRPVQHYVGTYTESQLKANAGQHIIDQLQSDKGFPDLQFINHRQLKNGKTEVWLSTQEGPHTIKA